MYWSSVPVDLPVSKRHDHDCLLRAGPIGIAVVHCLLAHSITSVTVSEPSPARGAHAKVAGAAHVINPMTEDVLEMSRSIGDGRGFHAVVDCAGVQAAFDSALDCVRGRGKIVNVALFETPLVIKTPNLINRRSITYVGSNIYTRDDFQAVIDAIAGGKSSHWRLTLRQLIRLSRQDQEPGEDDNSKDRT